MLSTLMEMIAGKYKRHHALVNVALLIVIILLVIFGMLSRENVAQREATLREAVATADARAKAAMADCSSQKELSAQAAKINRLSFDNFLRDSIRSLNVLSESAGAVAANAKRLSDTARQAGLTSRSANDITLAGEDLVYSAEELRKRTEASLKLFENEVRSSMASVAVREPSPMRRGASWLVVLSIGLILIVMSVGLATCVKRIEGWIRGLGRED